MQAICALHDAPWETGCLTFDDFQSIKSKAVLVNTLRSAAGDGDIDNAWAKFILAAAASLDKSELDDDEVVFALGNRPSGDRGQYGDPELDHFITSFDKPKGTKKHGSHSSHKSKTKSNVKRRTESKITAVKGDRIGKTIKSDNRASEYIAIIEKYIKGKNRSLPCA